MEGDGCIQSTIDLLSTRRRRLQLTPPHQFLGEGPKINTANQRSPIICKSRNRGKRQRWLTTTPIQSYFYDLHSIQFSFSFLIQCLVKLFSEITAFSAALFLDVAGALQFFFLLTIVNLNKLREIPDGNIQPG